MNAAKTIGIVLLVLGSLGLAYGEFSYTKESTKAKIGPIELKVQEKERINIPLWGSVAAIVIGGVLVLTGRRS
jgi:hypothetical protein